MNLSDGLFVHQNSSEYDGAIRIYHTNMQIFLYNFRDYHIFRVHFFPSVQFC